LYCTNRLHDSSTAFRVGVDGLLSLIEIRRSGGGFPQNLAITDDGRFLICCNIGGEQAVDANIAVFGVDRISGRLTPIGRPSPAVSPACSTVV